MIDRPMTREQWLKHQELHISAFQIPEAEVLKRNVDWLLNLCYVPDSECGHHVRTERLGELGIEAVGREAINWGDLYSYAQRLDDGWLVTVEEASDGACPELCRWLWQWLHDWGWPNITVKTEW